MTDPGRPAAGPDPRRAERRKERAAIWSIAASVAITLGKGIAWLHGKRYAGKGRASRVVAASTARAR